jgi:hypothetical protein
MKAALARSKSRQAQLESIPQNQPVGSAGLKSDGKILRKAQEGTSLRDALDMVFEDTGLKSREDPDIPEYPL